MKNGIIDRQETLLVQGKSSYLRQKGSNMKINLLEGAFYFETVVWRLALKRVCFLIYLRTNYTFSCFRELPCHQTQTNSHPDHHITGGLAHQEL